MLQNLQLLHLKSPVQLNRDEKINAVAQMVGYQDVKYFSRLFEKIVGLKPAQYRKLMR